MDRVTWKQIERWSEQHGLGNQIDERSRHRWQKARQKVLASMNANPDRCFCVELFGHNNVPRSGSDKILETFTYRHHLSGPDGPVLTAHMRRCYICGRAYSDEMPMA